jgi:hypothetical protein
MIRVSRIKIKIKLTLNKIIILIYKFKIIISLLFKMKINKWMKKLREILKIIETLP